MQIVRFHPRRTPGPKTPRRSRWPHDHRAHPMPRVRRADDRRLRDPEPVVLVLPSHRALDEPTPIFAPMSRACCLARSSWPTRGRSVSIPAPPSPSSSPCDGLMQEIRILLHQGEPQSLEIAAAKALEIARYCARTANAMQFKGCPVITRAEIDAHNKLIQRSAS